MIEPVSRPISQRIWGVAALVDAVGAALSERFSSCTVRGEISGFTRAASGHCYFSLKDADGAAALVRCAMFRRAASLVDFTPTDGQQVDLLGRVAVYEPRGELQFVVEAMRRVGAGTLFEQFMRLKAKLEAEGLFNAERKREISAFPRRIGVVTSPQAAALRDVATTLARRAPHVEVIVYPSPVQGVDAPPALAEALALAGKRDEVDTLILCRGGGSMEDLWAFNDERVVRAVVASAIPVICGVGHETDITLADFAADLRAPTPTAAAELAAPATEDCLYELQSLAMALQRRMRGALETQMQRLDRLVLQLARPGQVVAQHHRLLSTLEHRRQSALASTLQTHAHLQHRWAHRMQQAMLLRSHQAAGRLDALQARLHSVDPKRVLTRGYAWLSDEAGRPVTSVHRVQVGQSLKAQWADGHADMSVTALPTIGD